MWKIQNIKTLKRANREGLKLKSQKLFQRFNRIALAGCAGLIFLGLYLFKLEYEGIYKRSRDHLDLYVNMERKILEYALENKGHKPQDVSLTPMDFCVAFVMDLQGKLHNHSFLKQDLKQRTLDGLFKHSIGQIPGQLKKHPLRILVKGPETQWFPVGKTWAYKVHFKGTHLFFVAVMDHGALKKEAFLESVDTLVALVGMVSLLMLGLYGLIRREFINPSKNLIRHLEQESQGISGAFNQTPLVFHKEWVPWMTLISKVFQENRRLIKALEDHVQTLDRTVQERTQEIQKKNDDLEQAYQDLQKTQENLIFQEKMASLGTLSTGIAHEMKNPLNFIVNFSEVSKELMEDLQMHMGPLLERAEPLQKEEIQELLTTLIQNMNYIREHGQRADHIIRSMLVQAHGGEAHKTPVDIGKLLREIVELALSGFKGQHHDFYAKINLQIPENIPLIAVVEKDVGRAFLNILSNAFYALWCKKQDDQRYEPTLWITVRELDQEMEIRLRDNGEGIPKPLQSKIFEPFFTTKPTGQGTGLGLSLCYETLVTHHRGTLDIESQEGNYTEFIVRLPKMSF